MEFNCSQPRVKKRPGTGLVSQIFMLSGIGVAEGGAGLVASANHGPIRASTRDRKARFKCRLDNRVRDRIDDRHTSTLGPAAAAEA